MRAAGGSRSGSHMSKAARFFFSVSLSLVLVAGCSCETPIGYDGDAGRDAGPLPDAPASDVTSDVPVLPDAPSDAGPPSALVVERYGARIYGSVLAVTRLGRTLWL